MIAQKFKDWIQSDRSRKLLESAILRKENSMKISARNQIKGKVVKVEKGAVNAIVKLDIGGGNIISATVSLESVKELGIKEGKKAVAIIKATSVMIGVKE